MGIDEWKGKLFKIERKILLGIETMNNPHNTLLCRRNYEGIRPMMRI